MRWSVGPPSADKFVSESDGAHTFPLIVEALGKVMSGVVGVADAGGAFRKAHRLRNQHPRTMRARRLDNSGLPEEVKLEPASKTAPARPMGVQGPPLRRRLDRCVQLFRATGPTVQTIGLVISAFINNGDSVTARKRKTQDTSI
jgi:hypothetical protein